MLIRILYADGRFDMVKPFFLDWLIASGRVVMFRREDGWVVPGRDPLRHSHSWGYKGEDRRLPQHPPMIVALAARLRSESHRGKPKSPGCAERKKRADPEDRP